VTTLVDTDILVAIATNDPRWAHWSLHQLDAAAIRGSVLINAVVYYEFSIAYARIEEVDRVLVEAGLELTEIPRSALFLAGKVFQRYRALGGSRTGVLPEFLYRRPCCRRAVYAARTRSPVLQDLFFRNCADCA
jgi:hypothetical protein